MSSFYNFDMANKLKEFLLEQFALKNLSQSQFCEISGIAKSSVSKWVNHGAVPETPSILAMSKALNVPPNLIFEAIQGKWKPMPECKRKAYEIANKYDTDAILASVLLAYPDPNQAMAALQKFEQNHQN